jgi:hypothetical protein
MLRDLASDIETGAVPAQEVMCIIRNGVNAVGVSVWGEYRGNIAALGLLESAKSRIPTANVYNED